MKIFAPVRSAVCLLAVMVLLCPRGHAAEHVTLKNGFEVDCAHRQIEGDKVRLYFADKAGASGNFMEVAAASILRVEQVPDEPTASTSSTPARPADASASPTNAELKQLLTSAGNQHQIDADMLASVVAAESGGHARAISRTGARGLMQLMPGTAAHYGVADAFQADQNIAGGTAYLDQLLIRYHENIALALAAYNAGPGAVDRWHGVPPYRETQAYVVRVIREFNRRKLAELDLTRVAGLR